MRYPWQQNTVTQLICCNFEMRALKHAATWQEESPFQKKKKEWGFNSPF